ncbi:MAG: hypothetical protein QOK45_959 [Mycobacterium sp.]|nr:hypothetical protein [Mycobacterium sp.]
MTVGTMEGGTLPMPPDLKVAITSQSGAAEPEFVHNVGALYRRDSCLTQMSDGLRM